MSKYKETKLGDLIGIKHGYAFKGKDIIDTDNGIVLVTPGNFDFGGGFKDTGKKFFKGEIPEEFILKSNDLIVTMTDLSKNADTLGYSALIPSDENIYLHNQRIGLIDIKSDLIYEDYLYWVLRTPWYQRRIANTSTGVNVKHTSPRKIYEYKFSLPDLETQEKIADILSTYDRLIENNNRRIEILEKTAEEIYKEWFVRMRFPGHENTKFIKGIPEGWEVKRVGDLAKFKRGKNLVIRDAIPGEIPVIAGGMEPSCYHNESNTNAPVITVSASGANAGYTQLNHIDVWASDCSYIDINDTDLIYYIYLLLKVAHKEILNLQLGSAQPHVYARDLNKFKFLKPEMRLIKIINNYAKDIFEEIKYLSSMNQNLIKQRDLLLPRLMNGTIEVK